MSLLRPDQYCGCCLRIHDGRTAGRVFARWCSSNGDVVELCRPCLNLWLDNADDDPYMEPTALFFRRQA